MKLPAPRRVGRRPLAVVALVGCVAAAGVLVLGRGGGDPDPGAVRFFPARPAPAGPAEAVDWWSPVRGEPLGIAADGDGVAVTALDEVRLLDARAGRTRWRVDFPGVRRYRPAIDGTRVAATSETELVVLDRADGRRVATVPFAGPGPAALFATGGRHVVAAGSEAGVLVAADADTGETLWSASHPGLVTVAPQAAAGVAVAVWHHEPGGAGATLRAFDAAAGTPRWEAPLGEMGGAPVVAGGSVLVADGTGVHHAGVRAIDLQTGHDRWRAPLSGWFDAELEAATDLDTAYVLDGMGTVVALDLAAGTVRWRTETGRPLVAGRVVLTPGAVVFASYDDELLALDRATGRLRTVEPQRGVPVDLAPAGDRLAVALRLGAPSRVEARPEP